MVVLEALPVGFRASGRNAGFSTKLFGLEPEMVLLRWGKQKMIDAHHYLKKAVAHTQNLIETHGFQSDYCHTGMVRISYSQQQLDRMKKTYQLLQDLGVSGDPDLAEQDRIRQDFHSERFIGGIYETDTAHLNPCKQVANSSAWRSRQGWKSMRPALSLRIERAATAITVATEKAAWSPTKS